MCAISPLLLCVCRNWCGIILTIGSAAYLWMLSGKMLLVTAIWMAITIWGGFVLVARVYKHMATLRETEDKLYTDFQTVLEGRKELTRTGNAPSMCLTTSTFLMRKSIAIILSAQTPSILVP